MKPLDDLKDNVRKILGDDPLRRYTLTWIGIYAAILLVSGLALFALSSLLTRTTDDAQAIQSKRLFLAQFNLSEANTSEMLKQIKESAEIEQTQFIELSQISSVIGSISNTATLNQVTVKKINSLANEEIKEFPFTRVPLALELEGPYPKIGDFLGSLSKSVPWFFSVDRIKISGTPQYDGKVLAEMRLVFYWRKE